MPEFWQNSQSSEIENSAKRTFLQGDAFYFLNLITVFQVVLSAARAMENKNDITVKTDPKVAGMKL